MKLVSFEANGEARFGAVRGDEVADLTDVFVGVRTLRQLLAADRVQDAAARIASAPSAGRFDALKLLPVIPDPDKIIMVAVNYDDHRIEAGRDRTEHPVLFLRLAQSQIGHNQPLVVPKASHHFDYEGEIVAVIGKGGRHIARDNALAHVAGFSGYNDASVRDWQRHASQFTAGKNWDGTGAFGPWLLTSDEVPDYKALTLETRLNGEVLQSAVARDLIFDVEALIVYISTFTALLPGDVIVTGTCGGVGFKRTPPIFMKAGDVAEIEIGGLGVLRNPVVQE